MTITTAPLARSPRRKAAPAMPAEALIAPPPVVLCDPDPDLLAAAVADLAARGPLLDWLEEHGYPPALLAAYDLRSSPAGCDLPAAIARFRLAVAAEPPPPLPYAALASIFAASDLSARQRIEAFLRVDTRGAHPGIVRLRERQAAARKRLARIDRAIANSSLVLTPTARERSVTREQYAAAAALTDCQRWDRRAARSGDREAALALAERYHRRTAALYQSRRAFVAWGRGGQEDADADAYSRYYNRRFGGASWRNAGVWIDYTDPRRPLAVIENFRGTEVARVPLS